MIRTGRTRVRDGRLGRPVLVTTLALAALGTMAPAAIGVPEGEDPPSAVPSRVGLSLTERPATSQAVTWRTDAATGAGALELEPTAGGGVTRVSSTPGEAVTFTGWGYESRHHSAVATGLTPDTRYRYRVGGGDAWSPWREFETASNGADPFTMLYFGDAQNDVAAKWTPVVDRAFRETPEAELMLHAGDLIDKSDHDHEWGDWFGALEGHIDRVSAVTTPGNHELSGDGRLVQFTEHFSNPLNGGPFHEEATYYTDYQGVRFISLDSNSYFPPLADQTLFLETALRTNPGKWSVVTFHHPVYSGSEGRDNPHIRLAWRETLERNDVDLVLQGHDHVYSRGYTTENGPVYAVTVSGPKYYDLTPDDDNNWSDNGATRVAGFQQTSTYQEIRVDGDELAYRSVIAAKGAQTDAPGAVGDTLDAFTITKSGDDKLVTEGATFPSDETETPGEGDPAEGTPGGQGQQGQDGGAADGRAPSSERGAAFSPGSRSRTAVSRRFRLMRTTFTARTGTARLRLSVPGRGRLTASARRTGSGQRAVVARARGNALRAGTVTLRLNPTQAGRRQLQATGRLKMRVLVTYRSADGTARRVARTLVLRLGSPR